MYGFGSAQHSRAYGQSGAGWVGLGWFVISIIFILSIRLARGNEGQDFDDGWMAKMGVVWLFSS